MPSDWEDESVDDGYQGSDGMSSESEEESPCEEPTTPREELIGRTYRPRYWNYGLRPHWMTVEEYIYRYQLIVFMFLCHKREMELWYAEVNFERNIRRRRANSI